MWHSRLELRSDLKRIYKNFKTFKTFILFIISILIYRSEDFLNAARRDTNSALGGYNKYNVDPNHAVRRQQRGHMRAVSEANLLDMEPRSRDRGGGHGGHGGQQRGRSRSRSRLDHNQMEAGLEDDEEPYQVKSIPNS